MTAAPRTSRARRARRVVAALVAVLLVALVGAYWYARPLLLTGTGYAAHSDCAVVHLAGRPDPARDLPANPLVPYLRGSRSADGASTTLLGVLSRQTAWYTPGYGCTLAVARPNLGPAPAPPAQPHPFVAAPATPDAALGAALDAAFADGLGTRGIVVVRDGRIVAERYAPGFDAGTRQLGWSMSKSVTNLLVGRLVAEGRVRLEDARLRPEWTDGRAAITVEHLMRMTSGLSWDETYDLGTPITRMLYLEPDMAGYAASRPLAHAPGTYQQYSSGSTNILCSVLRDRSGLGPGMAHDLLFGRLGLASAVWEPDAVGTPVCSSYLWATPRDWAALGQFALDDGVVQGERLLPEGWLRRSTTVDPVAGEEQGYAAGWKVNRLPDGSLLDARLPADTYWASGHDGQRLFVVPSARLVVVRLGFTPGDTRVEPLVAAAASTRG